MMQVTPDQLMAMMNHDHGKATNVFEIISHRITATIEEHIHFQRVDDVMNHKNEYEAMEKTIAAQIRGSQSGKEEWEDGSKEDEEKAFVDSGRVHITRIGSLAPVMSLFTTFNYVRSADASKKEEIGFWEVKIQLRDQRIIDQYQTTFKNFMGNVFDEKAFKKLLTELSAILDYIIEIENLPTPRDEKACYLDLDGLTDIQQTQVQQVALRLRSEN